MAHRLERMTVHSSSRDQVAARSFQETLGQATVEVEFPLYGIDLTSSGWDSHARDPRSPHEGAAFEASDRIIPSAEVAAAVDATE